MAERNGFINGIEFMCVFRHIVNFTFCGVYRIV